ncbi:MAG: glycosyltransferase family 2 protein [Burkholderiales bacterium]
MTGSNGGFGNHLSVVIPAYNEEPVLASFHARLMAVLDGLDMRSEVLYVNDGSTDGTLSVISNLRVADPRVGLIDLSRNFGKEIAMTAGLDHASGDAVIVIDADLQDPPEIIPALVAHWREGFDVVYAKRTQRRGDSAPRRYIVRMFYRVIQSTAKVHIPADTGDFRLLSRRAVEAMTQLREQHRFMKGLFAWIGYAQKEVRYVRDARFAGKTKWNYWKLWNFALEGITSFTIAPLKVATYIGLATALGAFVFGLYIVTDTLLHGNPVAGYPSLMTVVLFLGGIQLMSIGVIGEYLGRMFNESKRRPLYFVNRMSLPTSKDDISSAAEVETSRLLTSVSRTIQD